LGVCNLVMGIAMNANSLILGMGSNLGDRLGNLRKALAAIQRLPTLTVLQVSPVYLSDALLPDNAPPDWDKPHLNAAIRCETSLEPLDLLAELKKIEWCIGHKPQARHWGPRIIDIDILVFGDRIIQSDVLTIPHSNLQERPFALWPLADVAPQWICPHAGCYQGKTAAEIVGQWGSRFTGTAPFRTQQLNQRIDTPQLVGIINATPDSFSDGGCFLQAEAAIWQAHCFIQSGAEVIDIGAESTAPNASPITAETEWKRLEPVLTAIRHAQNDFLLPPKISIDTRHADTAARALSCGVDWINDVTGLQDPTMQALLTTADVDCVIMHHLTIPPTAQCVLPRNQDPVSLIYEWALQRIHQLEKAGMAIDRIIIDPGIGFGKTPEQSLQLIKHITQLKALGTRVLVGHSRKSFLSLFTARPPEQRDIETLAATLYLAKQPVDYLRVHQVEMSAQAIRVMAALGL